jgi:hypothetical protein
LNLILIGWIALYYFLQKATKWNSNWISLRMSYGFNGILMKKSDIVLFKSFLESNLKSKPVDHLFYDFSMISKRTLFSFRHNLFYHIGDHSTLHHSKRYTPECYQVLYDWLQPFERFRNEDCPTEDISPCKFNQDSLPLVDFDLNHKQLCRLHFPICPPSVKTLEESQKESCRIKI